jgi:hypothetical protein
MLSVAVTVWWPPAATVTLRGESATDVPRRSPMYEAARSYVIPEVPLCKRVNVFFSTNDPLRARDPKARLSRWSAVVAWPTVDTARPALITPAPPPDLVPTISMERSSPCS